MPARSTGGAAGRQVLALALAAVWTAAGGAAASTVGIAGDGLPFATHQPSLTLTPVVQTSGAPEQLGRIRWLTSASSGVIPANLLPADGRSLGAISNLPLASQLGNAYGGDAVSFQLPDLRGRAATGTAADLIRGEASGAATRTLSEANLPPHTHDTATGPTEPTGDGAPFHIRQPGLGLVAGIQTEGFFPGPGNDEAPPTSVGFVSHYAGATLPAGVTPADGRLLAPAAEPALFSLFATIYGGDGRDSFGLPDAQGRLLVGAGQGPGLAPRLIGEQAGAVERTMTQATMPAHSHPDPDLGAPTDPAGGGQPISSRQPEIALTPLIAVTGVYPSESQSYFADQRILGEIAWFAGNFAPNGWAIADGSEVNIGDNNALFSLLGTIFGGDGAQTFALPDLRGRTLVGVGPDSPYGSAFGSDWLSLTAANLPPHDHAIDRTPAPGVIPLPGALPLLLGALALLAGCAARRRPG